MVVATSTSKIRVAIANLVVGLRSTISRMKEIAHSAKEMAQLCSEVEKEKADTLKECTRGNTKPHRFKRHHL